MRQRLAQFLLGCLLSGCSCEAGLGEKCETQDDCTVDLHCVDGHCAAEPARDAGPEDGGQDAGPPGSIAELPLDEQIEVPELEAPVDIVIDGRGMPHVYAESLHDASLGQAFMISRDRFAQLELGRRRASGRLAELAGVLSPSLIESDIFMRVIGLRRQAEAIWESVEPGSEYEQMLLGYASGVNAWIGRLRDGDEHSPVEFSLFVTPDSVADWSPVDSLVMGRYQQFSLGFDGSLDLDFTEYWDALVAAFPADSEDPALRARAGAVFDLSRFAPADAAVTRDGFPGGDADQIALQNVPRRARPRLPDSVRREIESVRRQLTRVAPRAELAGDLGSNNWVVSGQHTSSGAAMLANDPHLGLSNPAIFYLVHLNTQRGEGQEGINTAGVIFAGNPGVILGFNDHVAWGATTAYFDTTDVYLERLTPAQDGEPATVELDGKQVTVETISEEVPNGTGGSVHIDIEWVPHHGPLLPIIEDGQLLAHEQDSALSWRWTGFDVLSDESARNELQFVLGLIRARSVDDVETALSVFRTAPHNWVAADVAGDIVWTTQSRLPIRDARALTFDPETGQGIAPCFVLPGTGEAEWLGAVSSEVIPHDRNPERGFIATANQDQVGTTLDGNPFNGPHYTSWYFAESHRQARILERLEEQADLGETMMSDLQSIQADHQSPLGRRMTPVVLEAMQRADEEAASPGTHQDLQAIVQEASDDWELVLAARDRLSAWTFETPAGVGSGVASEELLDSTATSIFNVFLIELVQRSLGDEAEHAGVSVDGPIAPTRALLAMLEQPEQLRTYDPETGQSVLWDDLGTTDELETRDAVLVASFVSAIYDIQTLLGEDPSEWQWGRLHTLRLASMVPGFLPDIPASGDAEWPNGYPRPGDNFVVDASNPGLSDFDFSYGSGPAQRIVVELIEGGVRAEDVIAGGQSADPSSPHHSDEWELWRENQTHAIYVDEASVVNGYEHRLRLVPR